MRWEVDSKYLESNLQRAASRATNPQLHPTRGLSGALRVLQGPNTTPTQERNAIESSIVRLSQFCSMCLLAPLFTRARAGEGKEQSVRWPIRNEQEEEPAECQPIRTEFDGMKLFLGDVPFNFLFLFSCLGIYKIDYVVETE